MASHAVRFISSDDDSAEGALVLTNTDDVIARADEIRSSAAVVLQFPKWTDGRAYSQAVLLRGRVRYTGEIRATGDVVADMVPLLARCGFDAIQLRADQRLDTAQRVMGLLPTPYQATLAERRP
jgi:uncharacterized protein (DUF934 family)